jgi:DNA-binding protein HU-beta
MAKKPMTKSDMIAKISKDADISKAAAKAAMESFVEMVVKEVKVGRPFRVTGLGTFALKKSKARKGVNPSTGEPIKIKAKKRMAFKAGAQVKNLLNPKKGNGPPY